MWRRQTAMSRDCWSGDTCLLLHLVAVTHYCDTFTYHQLFYALTFCLIGGITVPRFNFEGKTKCVECAVGRGHCRTDLRLSNERYVSD